MQITDIVLFIQDGQRYFHDAIINDLDAIKSTGALLSTFNLALIGFLYGAFHAVGPGHGKVIVSTYLLANENSLKRGLVIVALSSLLQALVAITLVVSFFYILNLARAEVERATTFLDIASYSLILLVGTALVLRGVRGFLKMKSAHDHHHHHHHQHGHDCCNHQHMPDKDKLSSSQDFASAALMVLSIGIRPCAGAVLLLFFACMTGVVWPGILATLAMALGTALTTGLLAIITVKSKNVALRFIKTTSKGMKLVHSVLSLVGGIVIMLLGGIFLLATVDNTAVVTNPSNLPLMHLPRALK